MTKKAQVKKSTGRRSIKRSKRQVKQRRSTRRSTPRAKPRSRTSHYRNVRGGGKGLATLGVSTVGTGLGSTAAYLYLRNQRKKEIKNAILKFRETYTNKTEEIKKIIIDGYGYANQFTRGEVTKINEILESKLPENEYNWLESELLRFNFISDDATPYISNLNTFSALKFIIYILALFIKDCGFATALYISKQKNYLPNDFEFLRKNLNIVALYVQKNSTNKNYDELRKQKFVTKYTQFMNQTQHDASLDQESLLAEGGYLFDRIDEIPEIQNLQCIITPGAYDTFLGSYDTVYNTIDQYRRDTSGSGGPVSLSSLSNI
jgi:hypothetical protein